MSSSHISLRCQRCGSEQFQMPRADPRPEDVISCAGCGAQGRFDQIRADALRQAKEQVERALHDAFRGSRFFRRR